MENLFNPPRVPSAGRRQEFCFPKHGCISLMNGRIVDLKGRVARCFGMFQDLTSPAEEKGGSKLPALIDNVGI
jgi:hypothetical protein